MLVPAHVFREYDIRGVADQELTDDLIRVTGEAFGLALFDHAPWQSSLRVAVGRDCRLSSPRIFEAFCLGLVRAGVDVIDVGIGPTPLLYFGVHHLDTDGGVMITGSHNEGHENGLKMMKGKAPFFADDIRRLRDRVAVPLPEPTRKPGSVRQVDVSQAYVDRVAAGIDLSKSGLSVVVDGGNGSAGPLGVAAIRKAGLEPEALYCDM